MRFATIFRCVWSGIFPFWSTFGYIWSMLCCFYALWSPVLCGQAVVGGVGRAPHLERATQEQPRGHRKVQQPCREDGGSGKSNGSWWHDGGCRLLGSEELTKLIVALRCFLIFVWSCFNLFGGRKKDVSLPIFFNNGMSQKVPRTTSRAFRKCLQQLPREHLFRGAEQRRWKSGEGGTLFGQNLRFKYFEIHSNAGILGRLHRSSDWEKTDQRKTPCGGVLCDYPVAACKQTAAYRDINQENPLTWYDLVFGSPGFRIKQLTYFITRGPDIRYAV